MRKSTGALVAVAGLAVVTAGLAAPATAAPRQSLRTRYIVRTDSAAVTHDIASDVRRGGGAVDNVYSRVFSGLSATLTATQVQRLQADRGVQSVTPDQIVHATALQPNPTWGLDRIDQRSTRGNTTYRYNTTGAGVTAFVVDTGIRFDHHQFGKRAVSGPDFSDSDDNAADCAGHGTHVAGTIGGSTYGVAKATRLVAVRVLDCEGSGYQSDVIDGLDWVISAKPAGPAVVNLSLGGPASTLVDDAVKRTIAAGISVVVAAGNDDEDACSSSPARVPAAITVAATDQHDTRPWWSNYGRCVDVFAPGVGVRSAWDTSTTATATESGTSMAAPHVTGVVARYLQAHPHATPTQAGAALLGAATRSKVRDRQGSPDRLLYAAAPATAPSAPTRASARTSNTARTATLTWAPPADNGGRTITRYRVSRNGRDAHGVGAVTITVSAKTRSYTFSRLRTGSAYALSVRAVNSVGAGAAVTRSVTKLR